MQQSIPRSCTDCPPQPPAAGRVALPPVLGPGRALGRPRSPQRAENPDRGDRDPATRSADPSAARPRCAGLGGHRRTVLPRLWQSTGRPMPPGVDAATGTRAREPATTRASPGGSAGRDRARSGAAGACPSPRLPPGARRAARQAWQFGAAAGSWDLGRSHPERLGAPGRSPSAGQCDEPCRPRPLCGRHEASRPYLSVTTGLGSAPQLQWQLLAPALEERHREPQVLGVVAGDHWRPKAAEEPVGPCIRKGNRYLGLPARSGSVTGLNFEPQSCAWDDPSGGLTEAMHP